jgi:hypothetical protein
MARIGNNVFSVTDLLQPLDGLFLVHRWLDLCYATTKNLVERTHLSDGTSFFVGGYKGQTCMGVCDRISDSVDSTDNQWIRRISLTTQTHQHRWQGKRKLQTIPGASRGH